MSDLEQAISDLAGTIAAQAEAIETRTVVGPRVGQVLRIKSNVELLLEWARTAEMREPHE